MSDAAALENLLRTAAKQATPAPLADIQAVEVYGEQPAERLECYLSQMGNPYYFRVGSVLVQVSFLSDGKPRSERLKAYFTALKTTQPRPVWADKGLAGPMKGQKTTNVYCNGGNIVRCNTRTASPITPSAASPDPPPGPSALYPALRSP